MKSTTTILAALAMSVAAAAAGVAPIHMDKNPAPPPADPCAGPISYNNIELLYARTDIDHGYDTSDGGLVRIQYAPAANLYLTFGAEFLSTGYDARSIVTPGKAAPRGAVNGYSADIDEWLLNVGIGGHIALTPNIDLAGDVGLVWAHTSVDYDTPAGAVGGGSDSDSDTGWYVSPQLRGKWGCFTAHLGAEYRDVSDTSEWSYFARVYYQIAPAWDLTLGYRHGDDSDTFSGGVRWRY
jgi:hypothetical protein